MRTFSSRTLSTSCAARFPAASARSADAPAFSALASAARAAFVASSAVLAALAAARALRVRCLGQLTKVAGAP